MTKIHVFFTDAHSTPGKNNNRADWLGRFIHDLRPDVVIDGGDTADLNSLCSYDRGKRSAIGRSYTDDVSCHNEFQDRLWHPYKKSKKRKPESYRLIGNHEHRIEKAIDQWHELEGTISLNDLDLERYYDEVIPYTGSTPGVVVIDGVSYSHYVVSGAMGRPIGGRHHAYSLLQQAHASCSVGHAHVFSYSVQSRHNGSKIMALAAPAYLDYSPGWVGSGGKDWSSGVVVKRGVEDGRYDIEVVSIDRLRQLYG